MSDFADHVVAYVRAVTIEAKRRGRYRSWIVHVVEIEAALDVPASSLQTALRPRSASSCGTMSGRAVLAAFCGETERGSPHVDA